MRVHVAATLTICDKFRRREYEVAIPHFFEEMAEDRIKATGRLLLITCYAPEEA